MSNFEVNYEKEVDIKVTKESGHCGRRGGMFTSVGIILVLFILLVIITRAYYI